LTHFLADDSIVRFARRQTEAVPNIVRRAKAPNLHHKRYLSTRSSLRTRGTYFHVTAAWGAPSACRRHFDARAEAGNGTLRWFGRRLDMRGEIEEEYELDEIVRESAVAEKSAVAGKVRGTCLFLSL
jgi:hypothetical protein